MEAREMNALLVLARVLHFGRASELCHMSPSALSRCIKRLEQDFGQELFVRDKRSVALTPAGKLVASYCEEVLVRREQLDHSLVNDTAELQGELRLYCSVTASYSFLARILPAFRIKHPGIELKLSTGDQARSVDRVLAGEEDIVIAAQPEKLPAKLRYQELGRSTLRFIGPTIPCAVKEKLDEVEVDWRELPLILAETGIARRRVDAWFKRRGVKPSPYAQVSGHEAMVTMVGLGFGIAVVPEIVIANSPLKDSVKILDMEPEFEAFGIGLCAMARSLEDPVVKAFWDVATES
jgi:LysR family positive regulator for ilvC